MARVSASQAAEKWARNLRASTQDVQAGVQAVTQSPTQAAAQKLEKMRQNFNAALDSGKVERGLNRVTTEDWKRAMLEKGIPRLGAGADAAKPKMANFMSELLPHVDAGVAAVSRMPDMTLGDAISRSAAFITHMSNFKRSK